MPLLVGARTTRPASVVGGTKTIGADVLEGVDVVGRVAGAAVDPPVGLGAIGVGPAGSDRDPGEPEEVGIRNVGADADVGPLSSDDAKVVAVLGPGPLARADVGEALIVAGERSADASAGAARVATVGAVAWTRPASVVDRARAGRCDARLAAVWAGSPPTTDAVAASSGGAAAAAAGLPGMSTLARGAGSPVPATPYAGSHSSAESASGVAASGGTSAA